MISSTNIPPHLNEVIVNSLIASKVQFAPGENITEDDVQNAIIELNQYTNTELEGKAETDASNIVAADYKTALNLPDDTESELEQRDGLVLDNNMIKYCTAHNTKTIATCEADEAWTNGSWGSSGADLQATHGDDTTNYKVGSQGISITTTATGERIILLDFTDKDLSKFEDGSASTEDDYIELSVYCADISKINRAWLYLHCNVLGTYTDVFRYEIEDVWENGWNHLQIQKSAFIETLGSPTWDTITGISTSIMSADGTEVSYTIDAIRMTRKDPIATAPNPLQIEKNGVFERLMAVDSGSIYLGYNEANTGYEFKYLEASKIIPAKTFDVLYFIAKGYCNATEFVEVGFDGTNDNSIKIDTDDLILTSDGTSVVTEFLVDSGDAVEMRGSINGVSIYGTASKTGSEAYLSRIATANLSGAVFVNGFEDVSITDLIISNKQNNLIGA